jgi:hypothetical protein
VIRCQDRHRGVGGVAYEYSFLWFGTLLNELRASVQISTTQRFVGVDARSAIIKSVRNANQIKDEFTKSGIDQFYRTGCAVV